MTAGLHTIHSKHSFQLLPARCQSWTCHTSALTKDRQTILIQIDHEESILKQKVSRVKTDKRFKRTLIYHEESILKQESVRSKHIKDSKECLFIYHEESILKQSVSQVKKHKRFKRTLIYYDRNNTMHIFREIPLKSGQNCASAFSTIIHVCVVWTWTQMAGNCEKRSEKHFVSQLESKIFQKAVQSSGHRTVTALWHIYHSMLEVTLI